MYSSFSVVILSLCTLQGVVLSYRLPAMNRNLQCLKATAVDDKTEVVSTINTIDSNSQIDILLLYPRNNTLIPKGLADGIRYTVTRMRLIPYNEIYVLGTNKRSTKC